MRGNRGTIRKNGASLEEGINLTPLIDVVFVVLIMFIVIAPMLELDRIALADGKTGEKTSQTALQEESSLTIFIKEDDSIWLNKRPIQKTQLSDLLKREKTLKKTVIPQLYADKNAHFGTYQMVKNSLEAAGFEEMEIVLQPK